LESYDNIRVSTFRISNKKSFIRTKRIDILVNKTREELAKEYVTREEVEIVSERIMATMTRIDEKIDRLQSKTYFQE
jgi:hypothetical protein